MKGIIVADLESVIKTADLEKAADILEKTGVELIKAVDLGK